VVAFVPLALLIGCAINPVTGRRDFVMMTEAQEIAIGREYHQKILEVYRLYDDPELQAYVEQVGERLAAKSHRSDLIYRFSVLDSPEVNAFATPGGYIYITRGILAYLNSEAELAAVLGHEIGHVTARHSVRQHGAQQATQLGFILGSILMPELAAQGGADLYNLLGGVLISGYGRDMELEADGLGAQYIARVGHRPEAMLGVIGVLKNQELFETARAKEEGREPQSYHGLFATHPEADQRLQEAVRATDVFQSELASVTPRPDGVDAYLDRIDGMSFGPGAAEGVVRGRDFFHRDLGVALRFPAGWRIRNLPNALLAESQSNDAAIQISTQDLNKRIPPDEFIQSRLGLTLSQGQTFRADGLEGFTGRTRLDTQWGQQVGRVTVVYRGTSAWIMLGVGKTPAALERYDPAFLAVARSLRSLEQAEYKLAEGFKIRVVTAEAGTTYSRLVENSRLPNYPEARLRLLNGHYPTGEPEPGTLIKIVK
jgi:predicted Zn-dependent protease